MGKLNIAHHKSYHPYRRDNIERVRRDEEEARQKEAIEEGRMMLADSEARMDLLRQRAGLGAKNKGKDRARDEEDFEFVGDGLAQDAPAPGPSTLTTTSGHINLFEDIERQTMVTMPVRSTKKPNGAPVEDEKGVALAPSAKDLNPWYSGRKGDAANGDAPEDDRKRLRDLARKSVHDPLTSINSQLASRDRPSRPPPGRSRPSQPPHGRGSKSSESTGGGANAERLTRESSERQRALELIRRKKREMTGSETPSTIYGGERDSGGYGDVFNRREVEEVQKARRWDRGRDRDSGRSERSSDRERYGSGSGLGKRGW